jgi:site-specific recombinase XerD
MATDFALSLRRFLTDHMAGLRGCSPNTISSYRDTFKLLICYLRDERSIPPERLTLELIDVAAITAFLTWLRAERHNSPSTCNQRLAAISSFFAWLQSQDPARMACCQDILQIPSSKHDQPAIAHLTVQQTRLLLALPDRSTRQGRRDATLLATLYDTAARVQEIADLSVRDIRLEDPAIVALTGKGRKTRHVPIDTNTTALLAAYLTERRLRDTGRDGHPVFYNQHRQKLSRGGIAWILRKYQARATDQALAGAQLSAHVLRHYVDAWVMWPAGVFPLLGLSPGRFRPHNPGGYRQIWSSHSRRSRSAVQLGKSSGVSDS